MKWLWISRRLYERALLAANDALDLEATTRTWWHGAENRADQCDTLRKRLEVELRDERWRRQKAEAQVQYMQERIQRVLGLPMWPADESGERKVG